ncbi:TPA: hypothetical protein N0F65_010556 [Lagenidium giganteum]|uniref:Uncharacterized protein n=1 Tax=Lagenidium giganteum TaxID=4803 RepID=A0AAV2YMV5_9STRA|nr:TPA: hypothetical protein N0F65_010556 [Lagenidium giganteum]
MGCGALLRAWKATKVELHGQYSSNRLEEVHVYAKRISHVRGLAVLVLTPLPPLIVVLLTDAIPLAPPAGGLASSWTFWIRAWITSAVVAGGFLEQFRAAIPNLPVRIRHTTILAVATATVASSSVFALLKLQQIGITGQTRNHTKMLKPTAMRVEDTTYGETASTSTSTRAPYAALVSPLAQTEVACLTPLQKKQLVHQTLRLMYLLEFVLLVEYTETIVPLMYSGFVFMAMHLPNREYYSRFIDKNDDIVIYQLTNVLLYSALQFGSLMVLHVTIKRHLRLSPMSLLAFVLEKQVKLVQSHLAIWLLFMVNLMLDHCGADFSFRFVWLTPNHT